MPALAKETFTPVRDYLLIKEIIERQSRGGIAYVEDGREDFIKGEIVALGEGERTVHGELVPHGLEVGDVVQLGFMGAIEAGKIEVNGEPRRLCRFRDVAGKISED